jgi:hypothetical protein
LARGLRSSIELTSAIVVAVQTGTATAGGVGAMPCEQGEKKKRGDNKPTFLH